MANYAARKATMQLYRSFWKGNKRRGDDDSGVADGIGGRGTTRR